MDSREAREILALYRPGSLDARRPAHGRGDGAGQARSRTRRLVRGALRRLQPPSAPSSRQFPCPPVSSARSSLIVWSTRVSFPSRAPPNFCSPPPPLPSSASSPAVTLQPAQEHTFVTLPRPHGPQRPAFDDYLHEDAFHQPGPGDPRLSPRQQPARGFATCPPASNNSPAKAAPSSPGTIIPSKCSAWMPPRPAAHPTTSGSS